MALYKCYFIIIITSLSRPPHMASQWICGRVQQLLLYGCGHTLAGWQLVSTTSAWQSIWRWAATLL